MVKKCFVIQRFDGGRYDSLYDQVFRPAIVAAGFEPYRVDHDPSASIPIESIEREISNADACFAELSEDVPNVWFEVGYAIAREKPLCLICSNTRTRFPFDVQHRQIIRYSDHALPADFEKLLQQITQRLSSLSKTDVAQQHNLEVAKALSVGPAVSGLRSHELLALTYIFQGSLSEEVAGYILKQEMERAGFFPVAASLAVAGLKRKDFISQSIYLNGNGDPCPAFRVTDAGEAWLMDHQDELNLQVEQRPAEADGITDDDIPF